MPPLMPQGRQKERPDPEVRSCTVARRWLEELADVLTRASLLKQRTAIDKQAGDVLLDYTSAVQIVKAAPLAQPVCCDSDDDNVLALAVAAQADLIVSGDQDLLVLVQFESIPIITARAALQRFTASTS
jgi:uncharacterized protein